MYSESVSLRQYASMYVVGLEITAAWDREAVHGPIHKDTIYRSVWVLAACDRGYRLLQVNSQGHRNSIDVVE